MNTQTQEALKMAIEAIEYNLEWYNIGDEGIDKSEQAIQACKEALEQPAQEYLTRAQQVIRANNSAQEPVAWNEEEFNAIAYAYRTCPAHEIKMVSDRYQELVNYVLSIAHPAPLQNEFAKTKSWQGLSDDEITKAVLEIPATFPSIFGIARAIEQALKEKNER